ncbi:tripartite tricarboxylate transporter substrate binding protein [Candidimonas humi]|uniref:Bug family tripartite tricarboxylate transporter substrate binding protein n=1 Tax=Candidimonas humi TaxID=683355 RepID=A0ABV8NY09_9BURK|nr:tripartite tricarboxylate transporter substrate binding protein [Candidimonas humi]MBV6304868.1 tripartite tricarboxylate transporter substrate binding protein [Candidimonas humi]
MPRFSMRRRISVLAFAIAASGAYFSAQAENFPDHPIRLVVAYAPGGATDTVGRMLAHEMSASLGRGIVLENRAGGGTLVGTEYVRRSAADGYTLLFGTNAFVITPLLHDTATYDPVKDFQPVGQATEQSLGILVTPRLKIHTVQEFIAYAKAHPGKVNFASSGVGSAQHLAGEAFAKAAGIKMMHVPYKGTGPAMIDLLAGRVDVMFSSLVGNMKYVEDGRLDLIGTTGLRRSPATPKVPTVDESGLKGFQAHTWQGILAPAGTPAAVVAKLHDALVQAGKSPKISDALAKQGMEVHVTTPAQFHDLLVTESAQYKDELKHTQGALQ